LISLLQIFPLPFQSSLISLRRNSLFHPKLAPLRCPLVHPFHCARSSSQPCRFTLVLLQGDQNIEGNHKITKSSRRRRMLKLRLLPAIVIFGSPIRGAIPSSRRRPKTTKSPYSSYYPPFPLQRCLKYNVGIHRLPYLGRQHYLFICRFPAYDQSLSLLASTLKQLRCYLALVLVLSQQAPELRDRIYTVAPFFPPEAFSIHYAPTSPPSPPPPPPPPPCRRHRSSRSPPTPPETITAGATALADMKVTGKRRDGH